MSNQVENDEAPTHVDEQRGSSKSKLKSCGLICACLAIFGFVGWLGSEGYIEAFINTIVSFGIGAHFIFIGLYWFVALPCGAGYSILITAVGYAFGWPGVLTTEIGTFTGALMSFMVCRHGCKAWVKHRLTLMKPKTRVVLRAVEAAIVTGKGGFMLQMGLRVNPVLVMGWCNAFLAVTETSVKQFLGSTMLGTQVDIIMKTNVGVILRQVGDLGETSGETRKVMEMNLMIQIAVFFCVLLGGTMYTRWIMKTHFKNLDSEDSKASSDGMPTENKKQQLSDSQQQHDGRGFGFLAVLFRTEGSIVPRTLPVAGMSAFLSVIFLAIDRLDLVPKALLPILRHPIAVQMLGIVLGYIVVLRANVAVSRYFEGMSNVQFFASKWVDAFSQLSAFIRTSVIVHSRQGNLRQVQELQILQLTLLHWFSILNGLAINSLQVTQLDIDEDEYFQRLHVCRLPDVNLLKLVAGEKNAVSVDSQLHLEGKKSLKRGSIGQDAPKQEKTIAANSQYGLSPIAILGPLSAQESAALTKAEDKVDLVHSWIIEAIASGSMNQTILTQSPILSRVYQELSNGMLGYNQAYKIALVQFPFAFAQMLTLFLVAFALSCPIAVYIFTGGELLTPGLTFFTVLGFWGIHEIAVEIENPFGIGSNQLPMVPLHEAICESLWEASTTCLPVKRQAPAPVSPAARRYSER